MSIGKIIQLCNECKSNEKCKECKSHVPKPPLKVCSFCKFKQVPINQGKQILVIFGKNPIYIYYGSYGPYLEWFDNISIPTKYNNNNNISLESAIDNKFKCQSVS